MSTRLSTHSTIFITLLPLLSACAAYQTAGVTPVPSRLVSVTTKSGSVLVFDSAPAARIAGDTVYGRQDGVPRAIPVADIAETKWMAQPGDPEAPTAIADPVRLTGGEVSALVPGAHVRVTAPSLGWNAKTTDVAAVRGDTLLVRRAGGLMGLILSPRPVPLNAVTALDVSRNHGAHQVALTIGGLAGSVAGWFAGYGLSGSCPSSSGGLDFGSLGCEMHRAGGALLGMGVGVGLGLLIANGAVPEQWEAVPVGGPRVGIVVEPGGRLGLGVSVAS
jgi:hypothetical protein